MAIRELLRALEQEAERERGALLDRARDEAERVVAEAGRDRAERLRAAVRAHRAERQAAADGRLADAQRAWRREQLVARAAMLERLRAATERALADRAAGGWLDRLVDDAIAFAGDGPATLRCRPALADRVRARIAGVRRLCVEVDRDVGTGVQVEIDDGRVVVDATLEALLERWWPRLRIAALAHDRREAERERGAA